MLTQEEKIRLDESIDMEGFDYSFRFLSNWEDITDKGFHGLLKAYQEAADALEEYVKPDEEDIDG
jgi:hypothetical protein